MRKRIEDDLPWLVEAGLDTFHRYAFGSIRQCGSNAELAADYVRWLAGDPTIATQRARTDGGRSRGLPDVSKKAKALEFLLARALRGKQVGARATRCPIWSPPGRHAIDATAAQLMA